MRIRVLLFCLNDIKYWEAILYKLYNYDSNDPVLCVFHAVG